MKKHLLLLASLIISLATFAQDYEWAFTANKPPRTMLSSIRKNAAGEIYLACHRDTVNGAILSELEKKDNSQNHLWSLIIPGNTVIADMEFNSSQNLIVTGFYIDSIVLNGNVIVNPNQGFDYSGFIFEVDGTGNVLWLKDLNPNNGGFIPVDLFIAQNGNMYLTSEVSGSGNDFTAFHMLDSSGNIIRNKFNNDFEVRTYSHILADNNGNVFLSGTCGNFATFDTIPADPNFSYQNFIIGYDSTFTAQWFQSREYITFDHNNSLQTDGNDLYWAFVDYTNQSDDTAKVVRVSMSGNIISDFAGPIPQSFFPSVQFSMDSTGHSVLAYEVFSRIFLFRYDSSFNLEWEDTILTISSGFPMNSEIVCYDDSTFLLAGLYYPDTLQIGNFTLINPNPNANSPTDLFVCKWGYDQITSVNYPNTNSSLQIYPNPSSDKIYFSNENRSLSGDLSIFDMSGRNIYSTRGLNENSLDISSLSSGVYFINYNDKGSVYHGKFVKE